MLTKEKIYLIEEQTGVRQNELRRSLNEELRGGARKGPQQSAAGLYREGYRQGFQMIGNDGNMYYLNHQRMGKNNKMTAKWVKVKNTYQQPKKSKAPKKKLPKKGGKKPKANWKSIKIPDNNDLEVYDSDEDDISSPIVKEKGFKCNEAGECINCCEEGDGAWGGTDITDYKKYCKRNSPPYAANHYKCRGSSKEGNDGNKYKSTENKNGVYTWKKIQEKKPLKKKKTPAKKKKSGKVYGKPPTSIQMSQKVLDTVLEIIGKQILTAAFKKHATSYDSAFKKKHNISKKDTVYVVNSKFKLVKAKSISKNLYVYEQSFVQKLVDIIKNAN